MSRYRRCASDEILVVFGKAGKKTYKNPETGKEETLILPCEGNQRRWYFFVFPVIQDWKKMSFSQIT